MPPKTERFEMRMDGDMLAAIDQWRQEMGDIPRAEAIRMLVRIGLNAKEFTFKDMHLAPSKSAKKRRKSKKVS